MKLCYKIKLISRFLIQIISLIKRTVTRQRLSTTIFNQASSFTIVVPTRKIGRQIYSVAISRCCCSSVKSTPYLNTQSRPGARLESIYNPPLRTRTPRTPMDHNSLTLTPWLMYPRPQYTGHQLADAKICTDTIPIQPTIFVWQETCEINTG